VERRKEISRGRLGQLPEQQEEEERKKAPVGHKRKKKKQKKISGNDIS